MKNQLVSAVLAQILMCAAAYYCEQSEFAFGYVIFVILLSTVTTVIYVLSPRKLQIQFGPGTVTAVGNAITVGLLAAVYPLLAVIYGILCVYNWYLVLKK